jgi:hypothetical protein
MNIIESETPYLVEAKTCGCEKTKRSISYHFIESSHSLCLDKGELILAQIQACERLLKYAKDEGEINILKEETAKLRLALDLVRY